MSGDLSRRELFKLVGTGLVGAGVRPLAAGRPRSAAPAGDITSTLAAYMGEASTRKLPDEVVEKTKHVVLDTFAAMISGSDLPPGRFAIQFARGYKGDKVSTVGFECPLRAY